MQDFKKIRNRDPKTGIIIKGGGWGYKIKYENKKQLYFVNGTWVKYNEVPERKKYLKKYRSSEKPYFKSMYEKIKIRSKKHKEMNKMDFKNVEDLINHWHKQKEIYGNKCPITGQILTTERMVEKEKIGMTMSNLSIERLFSSITYTKQNTIFTSTAWNLSKHSLKFFEMPVYLNRECCDRHFKIVHQRFPELKDIGWEVIDGEEYDWLHKKRYKETN